MLRRLKIEHSQRPRQPAWPESTERHRGPLFASRARHRKLTALLDDDVLPETQLTAWGKPYLLAGLLSLEEIDCFRYADDGPPSNVEEQVDEHLGTYVRGWAVLDAGDESGIRGVRAATSNTITDNAIFSDLAQVAAADTARARPTPTYPRSRLPSSADATHSRFWSPTPSAPIYSSRAAPTFTRSSGASLAVSPWSTSMMPSRWSGSMRERRTGI